MSIQVNAISDQHSKNDEHQEHSIEVAPKIGTEELFDFVSHLKQICGFKGTANEWNIKEKMNFSFLYGMQQAFLQGTKKRKETKRITCFLPS